jgi:actin-like ATPase involved in cell morphogenesis
MGSWTLLIGFGAASTVAATVEDGALRLLDFGGTPWTPSAVFWSESKRELIVGRDAERSAMGEPWCGENRLGNRLGEDRLLLGEAEVSTLDAVAALLRHVAAQAISATRGGAPSTVLMTHPALWETERVNLLAGAASAAGLERVELVPEPVAAAAGLRSAAHPPGERLAVYDLGATRFAASVILRTASSLDLVGRPRGSDCGGDEFDRKLFRLLAERLDAGAQQGLTSDTDEEGASRARHLFIDSVRAAKEQLSVAMSASVELPPPFAGTLVVTRGEFESLIEDDVRDTVRQLQSVIEQAGGVSAVCLAGASIQIPLVARVIGEETGLVAECSDDPRSAAVRGLAALLRPAVSYAPVAATAPEGEPDVVNALDEDVQFTVYRPQRVEPDRWYTLLAFAHKSDPVIDEILGVTDPVEEVRSRAVSRLGEQLKSYVSTEQDSSQSLARGSELTFVPRAEGLEFNPPSRTFRWQEPVHQEEFRMRADAALEGRRARGVVAVYAGVVLIAEIRLNIRVGGSDDGAQSGSESARPYRRIFVSYSHKDEAIVEQVEQVLSSLGDEVLRDKHKLRAGEEWEARVEQMIREAEIFQLFWSTNSMSSGPVRREWTYALTLKRPNFIRPTYWEDPMPARPDAGLPPQELLDLHFHRLPSSAILHLGGDAATTAGDAALLPSVSTAALGPSSAAPTQDLAAGPADAAAEPPEVASAPSPTRRAAAPKRSGSRLAGAGASLSGLAILAVALTVAFSSGGKLAGSNSNGRALLTESAPSSSARAKPGPETRAAAPAQSPSNEAAGATPPSEAAPAPESRKAPTPNPSKEERHPTAVPELRGEAPETRSSEETGRGSPAPKVRGRAPTPGPPRAPEGAAGGAPPPQPAAPAPESPVLHQGIGPMDIGPIRSVKGFLLWTNHGKGPFLLSLDGRPTLDSTAGSGRVALPALSYSDLRINTKGAWSIAIY